MHARIDQLLSLRDGEPTEARIVAHVAECPSCTAELNRLAQARDRLRALPHVEAPSWEQVRSRLQRPAIVQPSGKVALAVAASIAVVAIVVGLSMNRDDPSQQRSVETATIQAPSVTAADMTQVAALVDRSRQLEGLLHVLPERPAIERVAMAATIDTIEGRIQWLDFQLSYAPDAGLSEQQSQRLWRERVELMDSLVKVRYAEAGRLSF